jgi:hypothetical protein
MVFMSPELAVRDDASKTEPVVTRFVVCLAHPVAALFFFVIEPREHHDRHPRGMGPYALELRAAMSLARLWQQQDKRAGARQLLAEVYSWFTEEFDTADLQETKALLEE